MSSPSIMSSARGIHKSTAVPATHVCWRPCQQQQRQGRLCRRPPSCSSATAAGDPFNPCSSRSSGVNSSSSAPQRSASGSCASGSCGETSSTQERSSSLDSIAQRWSGTRGSRSRSLVGCTVRPADNADYWAIADLHSSAFYPKASFFWYTALRVDRVLSLQMGKERRDDGVGHFACLVADGRGMAMGSAASGSSSGSGIGSSDEEGAPAGAAAALSAATAATTAALKPPPGLPAAIAASQAAAAAQGRVDLGLVVDWFIGLFWPAYLRVNYASTYAARGLVGAVVIDTMGEFVPPKRRRMPNGTIREVPRSGICYLSNLAVAPCRRRAGVGARLLQEAEQLAVSWGCRSMALHVDPSNAAAIQMYVRAGYRKVSDQPEWQRVLEQRSTPLALYMRALPWEARQAAKAARAAAATAEQEKEEAGAAQRKEQAR